MQIDDIDPTIDEPLRVVLTGNAKGVVIKPTDLRPTEARENDNKAGGRD